VIEDKRGRIDYDESGAGPTIVLVPGSCSTGVAWRPIVSQWKDSFRCVTTSLLGYGGTAERRTDLDTDISHEVAILEAVIRRAACPVHLVGHSFGGLTAIAVAIRNKVPLLSLSILEAPAPEILRHMGEHGHYGAIREMTDSYISAFDAGEKAAIEQMIDFYGGAGTFAGWPQRVRDYAVATTPANILDWRTAYGFLPTVAALASIEVPTLVLWGLKSHPAIQRANELLAKFMAAKIVMISQAAHFMISTHPKETADVLAQHVIAHDGRRQVMAHGARARYEISI
jgi:pimeloyl-ACP methyl ester carboxylesterase